MDISKIKISELEAATQVTDDDYFVINDADTTKKVDATKIAEYAVPSDILQETDVVNNTSSTSTNFPLSANMGKSLQDQINNIKSIGRFLAIWDCTTGLPLTEPEVIPYEYHTGDYFRVGTVGQTNYKPDGDEYDGTASTTLETEDVKVSWVYYYDGTTWVAQVGSEGKVQDVQINGVSIVDSEDGVANIEDVVFIGDEVAEETEPVDADTLEGHSASYFAQASNTYTKTQVDSAISNHHDGSKQPLLTSGVNLKSINNTSLLTSGNLNLVEMYDTAGVHNSIVRGKDVTSYFTDGTLWSRIAGTNGFKLFEDLYLGDYINMGTKVTAQETDQGTTYGEIGSQYVTIAGFDTLMGNGSASAVSYHHLVMVAGQFESGSFHFGRHRMNATNTTVGGYVGSVMHTSVLGPIATSGKTYAQGGTINEQLYRIFGTHLKTTNELLSTSLNATGYNRFGTNSGCANNWAWTDVQAVLMSEVEVYGSIVWSSSGYDTGTAKVQLPLFALDEKCINNRSSYYWLKDVASAPCFAVVSDFGNARYYGASYTSYCVRPRFVLGA